MLLAFLIVIIRYVFFIVERQHLWCGPLLKKKKDYLGNRYESIKKIEFVFLKIIFCVSMKIISHKKKALIESKKRKVEDK